MQNIKREQIRQRFPEDIDIGKMEQHAINLATTQTDELLDRYLNCQKVEMVHILILI